MLRCPFNNFSKCDGSCPFSMPDFTSCRLATALVAIESICKGQAAQVVTTNAHLVEVKDKLDALKAIPSDDGDSASQRTKATHLDQPRLMLRTRRSDRPDARLILPGELAAQATEAFGDRCSYTITGKGEVLLFTGEDRKLSTNGTAQSITRSISMQKDMQKLNVLFPKASVVYLELVSSDGVFRLRPTGEVE